MRQIKTVLALLGCALLAGCANQHYLNNSSQILLEYQQRPTNHNLIELSKAYAAAINNNKAMGVVEPGLFADYAVTLVKLGHRAEANKMFNNEVKTYPSSAKYVRQLKLHLLPEFVTDTLGGDVDIDFVSLEEADNAANFQAEETESEEPVKLTKEEREEMKMDREAQREELKRAREQEREQREMTKKALEKQKKQLKKQEEKEKKQLRKQKEKERKALQKQREKEREAMREQREQEREALQKQREEQREVLKRQREEEREALQRQREQERTSK